MTKLCQAMKYEISELCEFITNFVYEANIATESDRARARDVFIINIPDSLEAEDKNLAALRGGSFKFQRKLRCDITF